ncbi:MAG: amidase family protein [Gemmatimonadota bacterium]|nr:amidase family protein [Gemmatimonadota bacterium]
MRRTRRLKSTVGLTAVLAVGCIPASDDSPFEVTEASIAELQEAMSAGQVTSADLVDAYLARIAAYDRDGPALNTIVRVHPGAREQAERLDQERIGGNVRGPLHGIPVLLKDNYDTFDMPTTGSTLALAGSVPPDDAFQVARLREAGAVILAKTNLHELAAGITSISSLGGQTRNPYAPRRNPGGSSGGTGAAVTASFGAIGWGSDTCGSIRIPSSVHNLVGLRPTKGLSSIDGIIPLSHTQDTGGPLARSVADLAVALDATVGVDDKDPATRALRGRALPRFMDSLDPQALSGARIGAFEAWLGESMAERPVTQVVRAALDAMVTAGADVMDVTIPDLDSLLARTGMIGLEFQTDFGAYVAATPGIPVSGLPEIVELGLHHEQMDDTFQRRTSDEARDEDEYQAVLARQAELRRALVAFMDENDLDAIAYPTLRQEPEVIGTAALGTSLRGAQVSSCFLAAHSGLPAISAPAGFTERALPVGIELMGRPFSDARLIALAYALEEATSRRRPPSRTPPLVYGVAPRPENIVVNAASTGPGSVTILDGLLELDVPGGTLDFSIEASGVAPEEVHAIVLQRRSGDAPHTVVSRLAGPGQAVAAGSLELSSIMLADLLDGRLELAVYTTAHPLGAVTITIDASGESPIEGG